MGYWTPLVPVVLLGLAVLVCGGVIVQQQDIISMRKSAFLVASDRTGVFIWSNEILTTKTRHKRHIGQGFSALRCRLYCQNGFYLLINPDGVVNGTRDASSQYGILEVLRVAVKLVSIRGTSSGNYVCMTRKGKMYGSRRRNAECVFVEENLETLLYAYSSRKYSRKRRQLYVGLNKKGRARKGKRRRQKGVQFVLSFINDDEDISQTLEHIPDDPMLENELNSPIGADSEIPDPTLDTVESIEE